MFENMTSVPLQRKFETPEGILIASVNLEKSISIAITWEIFNSQGVHLKQIETYDSIDIDLKKLYELFKREI